MTKNEIELHDLVVKNQTKLIWANLRVTELRVALKGLLNRYVGLVNCGDCGSWDPELEDEVIAARKVLDTFVQSVSRSSPEEAS